MESIIIDNLKGSELIGKLGALAPEKRYTISIQSVEDRKILLAELEQAGIEQQPDPAVAGKSEDEMMDMVNGIIDRRRARRVQSERM